MQLSCRNLLIILYSEEFSLLIITKFSYMTTPFIYYFHLPLPIFNKDKALGVTLLPYFVITSLWEDL